jgi:ElaB/YqjD/DUF883 family membrane-anchored ribosome-binding protein
MASPSTSSSGYGSSGSIEELKGKAKQTFEAASDRAQEMAGDARQQVEEVAGNVKGALHTSVREQPIATLLMAAAVGFVVGALWKS